MPRFAGGRADHRAIDYTAVGDVTDEGYTHRGASGSYRHTTELGRSSLDVRDSDANIPDKSKAVNHHIYETRQPSSEKAPGSKSIPTVAGWPQQPRKLRGFSIPSLVGDTLLILLPVAFLVLAISAWRLDGKELSDTGKMVERAMNLGPTIYPLAYAAVGGRCLRSIAIRLAERGTTISTLEKLLGGQSLVSAIGTAFTLRSANLLSIGLLVLWALSPLGGQSSLRLLREANSTISDSGMVFYSSPAAPMNLDEASTWFSIIPTILSASLASSAETKNLPVDLWNHPKVPRLDALEEEVLEGSDSEGDWINVDESSNLTYSSFTGINIQGLRPNTQSEFQVKYNYLRLGCGKYFGNTTENALDLLWNSTTFSIYPPLLEDTTSHVPENTLTNVSVMMNGRSYHLTTSFFLRYGWNSTGTSNNGTTPAGVNDAFKRQPISFLYGASFDIYKRPESVFQIYECKPRVITVDAKVKCQSDVCAVSRLRRTSGESKKELEEACDTGSLHRLGCLTTATYTIRTFFQYFPTAIALRYSTASIDPFDDWIAGSNQTYRSIPTDYPRNLSTIPDKMISDRLTTIVNTYWQAGAWGTLVTRAGLFEKPEWPNLATSATDTPDRYINSTLATFSQHIPVYRAEIDWIVTLLLTTIVLLLLSIINLVMLLTTIAPDLFYYASSLARENPYTNTPDGGTVLDGAERSRLLKKMKVQVADASPESEFGYVVLKSVDDGEDFYSGRLRKGRLYW